MANKRNPPLRGSARELYALFRELRERRATWSLRTIATKAGLSPAYASEILSGKKAPRPEVAERLASVLGASPREQLAARAHAEGVREDTEPQVPSPDRPYRLRLTASGRPGARPDFRALPPSQLLSAANQVVPFFGREHERRELISWRDEPGAAMSAMLLHGSGGQGKTRLAMQMVCESVGWVTVRAEHRSDPGPRPKPLPSKRLAAAEGVLVLVDYAERWPYEDLLAITQDERLREAKAVRLLLIARPVGGWWDVARTRLRGLGLSTGQLPLRQLVLDATQRTSAFIAARDAFAAELGVPGILIPLPVRLHEAQFAHALTLHMAALAAVDSHARGGQPPEDPAALSAYLLGRERDHWQRMHDKVRQPLRTAPNDLARAVFAATACGSQDIQEGARALLRAGIAEPVVLTVLDDHAVCYPSANASLVLEPLVPDRLGEDFLALQTPGHELGDYSADPWAVGAFGRLMAEDPAEPWPPRFARHGLSVLIEAAHRWPHLVTKELNPLLADMPHLLVEAGSATMARLAELPDIDLSICARVEALFLHRRDIELDVGLAAISKRVATARRLSATHNPAERAHLEIYLGWRLAMAGQYEEAATVTRTAVTILRALPAEHHSALARALDNLGVWLSAIGRHAEALDISREATELFGQLAEHDPSLHAAHAMALSNEGLRLAQVQRLPEAVTASREAAEIRRRLAAEDPDLEADLAMSLNNLGGYLAELGESGASQFLKEAVKIARRVAAREPLVHLPLLAASLTTLCGVLGGEGEADAAVAAGLEAVALYGSAAQTNPEAFALRHANALRSLSIAFWSAGRRAEALNAAEQAVACCRRVLEVNPQAYDVRVSLPDIQYTLAGYLQELDRSAEALRMAAEAATSVLNQRQLSTRLLEADLAALLGTLAAQVAQTGAAQQAIEGNQFETRLLQRLAQEDPGLYEADLAIALVNLGARANVLGDPGTALEATEQAVSIRRRLAGQDPYAHGGSLASALVNLAACLRKTGQVKKSIDVAAEAITTSVLSEDRQRDLIGTLASASVDTDPDTAQRALELAVSLADQDLGDEDGVALLLCQLMYERLRAGQREGALAAGERATEILRRLAVRDPDRHLDKLAGALLMYTPRLAEVGRYAEALPAAREAVGACRTLAARDPANHELWLAHALQMSAQVRLDAEDDPASAFEALTEAVAVYYRQPKPLTNEIMLALQATGRAARRLGLTEGADEIRAVLQRLSAEPGLEQQPNGQ